MSDATALHRLLLVDDDDTFRQVMASELSRRGHAVESARTGTEALERCATCDFDVILLDLRMPDMDGVEVLERLRAREVPAGVIVLTGHGTIDTAIHAIRPCCWGWVCGSCRWRPPACRGSNSASAKST